MVDLVPVDHDPFNGAGIGSGVPIAKSGQPMIPPAPDVGAAARDAASIAGDATGVTQAMQALRGEMTEDEAKGFALTAAAGLIPGARAETTAETLAAKAIKSAPQYVKEAAGAAVKNIIPDDFERGPGGSVIAYHGTIASPDELKMSGIQAGDDNGAWLASDKNTAALFATTKGLQTGTSPIVARVSIPADEFAKMKINDPSQYSPHVPASSTATSATPIPQEWIDGYHPLDRGEIGPLKRSTAQIARQQLAARVKKD